MHTRIELVRRKGLSEDIFEEKMHFEQSIEEHAAWVFEHIYSKPYPGGRAKIHHGMNHVCRASLLLIVLANLNRKYEQKPALTLTDEEIKLLQIGMLFHDAAREDDNEDKWDLQSAELYYYYLKMLGIDDLIAIPYAQAVANKDKEDSWFKIMSTEPIITWEEYWWKGEKTIAQKLVHDADCLDIIRARPHFDATYLDFFKEFAKHNHDLSFEDMAELIIETRSLIRCMGDMYEAMQFNVKELYEKHSGYKEILSLIQESNYPLLYELYNKGKLLSFDAMNKKTHAPCLLKGIIEKCTEEANLQEALRQGEIFARGIITLPSGIHKKSQTLGNLLIERSLAATEVYKSMRRIHVETGSSKEDRNSKHGNLARSVCQLSPGASILASSGYLIIKPDNSKIRAISKLDSDSGWLKKSDFLKCNMRFSEEDNIRKRKKLITHIKMGGSSKSYEGTKFPATYSEIIYDIDHYDAVYFTCDPVRANEMFTRSPEAGHPHSPFLQAIFLQKEHEKQGLKLPIFEYSGIHNFIRLIPEADYSHERIKNLWVEMCLDYFKKELSIIMDAKLGYVAKNF